MPVTRYLVPDAPPKTSGLTVTASPIRNGVPHAIALDSSTRVLVVVPTGVATLWRDADPMAPANLSRWETAPQGDAPDLPPADFRRAPVRLVVQRAGTTLGCLPAVAGLHCLVTDDAGSARLEFVVVAWDIRAGSLRGPGDFGSFVTLAWREADRAVDHFSDPPPHPLLVPRLKISFRLWSHVGDLTTLKLGRFEMKRFFQP